MSITFSAVFARKFNSLDAVPLLVGTHGNHDPHEEHNKVAAFNEMIQGQSEEAKTLRATYQEVLVIFRGLEKRRYHFPDLTNQAQEEARARIGEAERKADYHRRMVSAMEAPAKALETARAEKDEAERKLAEAHETFGTLAEKDDPARTAERAAAAENVKRYEAEQVAKQAAYMARVNPQNNPQAVKEAETAAEAKAAQEKAAHDRQAADIAITQKVLADKAHAAKAAAEKVAAEREQSEKAAASKTVAERAANETAGKAAPTSVPAPPAA